MTFADKYGPWALVTGASKGIGAEFTRQLAARGLNIVLVASHEDALRAQSQAVERRYKVATRVVTLDLSRADIIEQLAPATADIAIGLLVSNAAVSTVGPFLDHSLPYLTRQLDVNSRAGVMLIHHFGGLMAGRGRGGIVLLSSGSAQHGTPFSANYAATKAFNLILAESLWYELRPRGVDVLGLLAGATRTEGWLSNHPKPDRLVPVMDVEPTVAAALRALGRRPSVAPGFVNRLGYIALSSVTRARAIKTLGASMNKMFGPF